MNAAFILSTPYDTKFERTALRHKGFGSHMGLVRSFGKGSDTGALAPNYGLIKLQDLILK